MKTTSPLGRGVMKFGAEDLRAGRDVAKKVRAGGSAVCDPELHTGRGVVGLEVRKPAADRPMMVIKEEDAIARAGVDFGEEALGSRRTVGRPKLVAGRLVVGPINHHGAHRERRKGRLLGHELGVLQCAVRAPETRLGAIEATCEQQSIVATPIRTQSRARPGLEIDHEVRGEAVGNPQLTSVDAVVGCEVELPAGHHWRRTKDGDPVQDTRWVVRELGRGDSGRRPELWHGIVVPGDEEQVIT